MQYPAWKLRVLEALKRQEQIELNSGYDVRESLIAVSTMQQWVKQNTCDDQTEFLIQLENYYQRVRKNWAFPGEYSGGTATLGSCSYVIEQAVLNEQGAFSVAQQQRYRKAQQSIMSIPEPTSASHIRRWLQQHYPHFFMGWRECLRVE